MVQKPLYSNYFLAALQRSDQDTLSPHLDSIELLLGKIIYKLDDPVSHIYFVDRGFVSLVKAMGDGRMVEIGGIGIEGLTGSNTLFGIEVAAFESMVQIPGTAYCIELNVLRREMKKNKFLRTLLQRYTHFTIGQLSQTAACNRLHTIEQRCAHWMLIAHDNARADSYPLTHEFLAMMLGSQRSGISIAAGHLQKAGLVTYTRGQVTILDRPGLEAVSCECYSSIKGYLHQLFNPGKPF